MHFLFIYSSPGILGGIETLIGRMARWLVNDGHQVTVLTASNQNWANLLPKGTRCIALGERFGELKYYFHAGKLLKSLGIPPADVIKSFDLKSSWVACQLARLAVNDCKVIAGIYNPNVFRWEYAPNSLAPWSLEKLYLENFLECIPPNARFFCDVGQIEELQDIHHQKGVLWPIPIDTKQFYPGSRKAKWGKIVSVGRLSPMKEYNLYMVEVVKKLMKRGRNVSWSVYGEGQYRTEMHECIERHGLERVISMEGTVPYERFWQVLEDACIFVGMGTAILEAALFRVPNVVAVAYDREGLTYGPIYRLPRGSIGELSTSPPRLKVVDEIERILHLQPSEYEAEQEAVYSHVQIHAVEASMRQFLGLVQQVDPLEKKNLTSHLANYPLYAVRRLLRIPQ
jgi:Glycosyl transferases group 1